MERVEEAVLERSIAGINLREKTLRGELGEERTVLSFLRHLG